MAEAEKPGDFGKWFAAKMNELFGNAAAPATVIKLPPLSPDVQSQLAAAVKGAYAAPALAASPPGECPCETCRMVRAMREGRSIDLAFRAPVPGIEEIERATEALAAWIARAAAGRITATEMSAIAAAAQKMNRAAAMAYAEFERSQARMQSGNG